MLSKKRLKKFTNTSIQIYTVFLQISVVISIEFFNELVGIPGKIDSEKERIYYREFRIITFSRCNPSVSQKAFP